MGMKGFDAIGFMYSIRVVCGLGCRVDARVQARKHSVEHCTLDTESRAMDDNPQLGVRNLCKPVCDGLGFSDACLSEFGLHVQPSRCQVSQVNASWCLCCPLPVATMPSAHCSSTFVALRRCQSSNLGTR